MTSTGKVNVSKKLPAKLGADKGRRFATLLELQAAVLDACRREIDELAGAGSGLFAEERLVHDMDRAAASNEARDVWRDLGAALARAVDLVGALPPGKGREPYAFHLERFIDALSIHQRAQIMAWVGALGKDGAELVARARAMVVATYDRPGVWWWGDKRPEPRDLALLSLLARSFPDVSEAQQRQAGASWSSNAPTVSDVIDREMRAVRSLRRDPSTN
jgi:hypothetical protein